MEPMQIDADPQEDQQNASETNYIVENPTLVFVRQTLTYTDKRILCVKMDDMTASKREAIPSWSFTDDISVI